MNQIEIMPTELREQLRFQLERRLVDGDEAFERCFGEIAALTDELAEYEGKIANNPHDCLAFLRRRDDWHALLNRLFTYRLLQEATDTHKQGLTTTLRTRIEPLGARLVFGDLEFKSINESIWQQRLTAVPELANWSELHRRARRDVPHTLSRPEEELLAKLSAALNAWQNDLYQTLVDRTPFREFDVDGKTYHSMRDQIVLLLLPDRALRREGWLAMYDGYAAHRDLYAFALNRVISTNHLNAKISKFADARDEQAHDLDITRAQVAGIWRGIEAMTPLLHRYQRADAARRARALGVAEIEPWDLEREADDFVMPRYPVDEAFQHVRDALQILGGQVERELNGLLDPAVGRIDIYGGAHRRPGAFSISPLRIPGFFYLDQYHGTLDQLRTIAHEAGHTVHHSLIAARGQPGFASDGPPYVTETAAMTFEAILHSHLLRNERDPERKRYLAHKQLNDLVKVVRIGWMARFEDDLYRAANERSSNGAGFLTPDELDELSEPSAQGRSIFYPKYRQYLALWQIVHHFYSVPLYNLNYVISSLLTMEIMGRLEQDAGFRIAMTKLFSHPFDRPTAAILRDTVGIDFTREDWYAQAARQMEERVAEFECEVAAAENAVP